MRAARVPGDGIIGLAERHENAGKGFYRGFHSVGRHTETPRNARHRLANARA